MGFSQKMIEIMPTMKSREALEMVMSGKVLPDNLTIVGDFGNSIKLDPNCLPNNLTVKGSLYLSSSYFETLPKGLKVTSDLLLNYQWTTFKIPKDLIVVGTLYLYFLKVIIPKEAKVGRIWHYADPKDYVRSGVFLSKEEYNLLVDLGQDFIFSRKKILTLQKLTEIPELYQEVYYTHKNRFLTLLKKI